MGGVLIVISMVSGLLGCLRLLIHLSMSGVLIVRMNRGEIWRLKVLQYSEHLSDESFVINYGEFMSDVITFTDDGDIVYINTVTDGESWWIDYRVIE